MLLTKLMWAYQMNTRLSNKITFYKNKSKQTIYKMATK